MDKQTVVYPQWTVSVMKGKRKKYWYLLPLGWAQKYYAAWKSGRKQCILSDFIYLKFHSNRKQTNSCVGLIVSYTRGFGGDGHFLKSWLCGHCVTINLYKTYETVHLKLLNFMEYLKMHCTASKCIWEWQKYALTWVPDNRICHGGVLGFLLGSPWK